MLSVVEQPLAPIRRAVDLSVGRLLKKSVLIQMVQPGVRLDIELSISDLVSPIFCFRHKSVLLASQMSQPARTRFTSVVRILVRRLLVLDWRRIQEIEMHDGRLIYCRTNMKIMSAIRTL